MILSIILHDITFHCITVHYVTLHYTLFLGPDAELRGHAKALASDSSPRVRLEALTSQANGSQTHEPQTTPRSLFDIHLMGAMVKTPFLKPSTVAL